MKLQLRGDDGELLAESDARPQKLDRGRGESAGEAIGTLLRSLDDPIAFLYDINEDSRVEYGLLHENTFSHVLYRLVDGSLYKAIGVSDSGIKSDLIRIEDAKDWDIENPPGKVWVARIDDYEEVQWEEVKGLKA